MVRVYRSLLLFTLSATQSAIANSLLKLATRYSNSAWESLKNVTTHQRHRSSESLRVTTNPNSPLASHTSSTGTLSNSKDHKALSHRRSSYLGIRNFFANISAHRQKPSTVAPFPRHSHFSTSTQSHFRPSVAAHGAQIHRLTPEEEEWLHNSDVLALASSSTPGPRFDWRMRASSRARRDNSAKDNHVAKQDPRKRSIKRLAPSPINVEMGEPFYEEIKAYSNRYVGS